MQAHFGWVAPVAAICSPEMKELPYKLELFASALAANFSRSQTLLRCQDKYSVQLANRPSPANQIFSI